MRKYLKQRNPKRGTDPIEAVGNIFEKIGKTPWLLFGILLFSTLFFIIHGSLTGLTITQLPEYKEQPFWNHIVIGSISLAGLLILKKYVRNKKSTKKYKQKSK